MDRDTSLLDAAPEAAARLIALGGLDEAAAASGRLRDPKDAEALHDFRVGLRRLRSFLRAYRALLPDGPSKKERRALRDLAARTTIARDSEVQLAWLEPLKDALKASALPAWSWLVERLKARHAAAYDDVRGELLDGFHDLEPKLRRSLSRYEARIGGGDEPPRRFSAEAASLLEAAVKELDASLSRVETPTDVDPAHRGRIDAKRLRYLLEPLRATDVGEDAVRLVKEMKRLQDLLGELHDAHVLAGEIADAMVESTTERLKRQHEALYAPTAEPAPRDLRNGLLAIDRVLRDRVQELFEALAREWLGDGFAPFAAEVRAFAQRLGSRAVAGIEIERKYLLRAFPALDGLGAIESEIAQGWIPGLAIRERLRRVVRGGSTRYFRTVKSGRGLARLELEDPTDAAVFERLWPLTEGKRVHKKRYAVQDGERVWEIDRFSDRELVLAEVELPSVDAQVTIPGWLEPVLVREVTGEDEYVNEKLAK